ncbi:CYTH domain-containing protein [Orrella marina]|uniref:Uncharacterized protein n=1 Tax=Orrella marina TaxID=2163011 RepID=A0A2R4XP89_9BURK|nr:hypothetical protein [Orrella marina]AWB35499.1 hypothetical protein DBV39_19085 [Orrella marina]
MSQSEEHKLPTEFDKRITNREFKLLLDPEGLDRRSKVNQLIGLVRAFCDKEGVEFFHLDNADTGLRNVYFFDTPGEELRHNHLILRVRESRQNVWVDDWCEVTLKCRAPTLKASQSFQPVPDTPHKHRLRLKEEILRGDGLGTTRCIYSNNSILDSIPIESIFERTWEGVIKIYPDLARVGLDKNLPVRIVGGAANKILEASLPLGNLVFGDRVQAHCDLAIWMRSVGEPIIGELAFAYRVNDQNREDKKAHKRANVFFRDLQLAIHHWLAPGTTKTAMVYGKPE